jgi:ankyrin repeat protein
MFAVREGNADAVSALLAAGSDVSAKNNDGDTAPGLAEKKNYGDIIVILETPPQAPTTQPPRPQ